MLNFYRSAFYQSFSCFSTTFKTIKRNLQWKKLESEVSVLDKFISSGSVCVDVGAAYGRYTYPMSQLIGNSGHIYSFEPGKYSLKVLSAIIRFHKLKNVTVIRKAVSDKVGSINLISPIKNTGKVGPSLSYISESSKAEGLAEKVEMTTLDSYCLENNISKVDFIKCDTEGAEMLVFKGAQQIIAKNKPTILAEIDENGLSKYNYSCDQVYTFFANLGYNVFILKENSFKKVDNISYSSNYFFIHSSKQNSIN